MKAIYTKFIPATNYRSSRVKATDEDGNSKVLDWEHGLDTIGNHRAVAVALIKKMKWNPTKIVSASMKNGYVWTMLEYRPGVPVETFKVNPRRAGAGVRTGRKFVNNPSRSVAAKLRARAYGKSLIGAKNRRENLAGRSVKYTQLRGQKTGTIYAMFNVGRWDIRVLKAAAKALARRYREPIAARVIAL